MAYHDHVTRHHELIKHMATNALSSNILLLDIETVTLEEHYDQLPEGLRKAWDKKAEYLRNPEEASPADLYFERGSIYAEFGKVVVISVGFFHALEKNNFELRVKCISGDNERELLQNFKETVLKFDQKQVRLCAHNGKEFDFPYLCRRMLVNGVALPPALALSGKKSWEVNHIDTMDLWKFGDYKHYTSLDLLAALFGIDAGQKSALEGNDINRVYYREGGLDKIARYCKHNITLLAQVYLRLHNLPVISQENITVV